MTSKLSRNFAGRKCDANIREADEREEKLCDEVKTVREYIYPSDRMSACRGCEAAVTA